MMVDAGLITFREVQPWAEAALRSVEHPPAWICDLVIRTYSPEVSESLGRFLASEPFESFDWREADEDHLASLYLRYERGELSWAVFLDRAGRYADGADGMWECEEFFEFLNVLEDAVFSAAVETDQREGVRSKLSPAIARIRPVYDQLRAGRRAARER
jgi:hypothetical protein